MQDDTLTLNKAVMQAKSSELVKESHEILKGGGKDGKINHIRDTKWKLPKIKENCPRIERSEKF